MNNERYDELIQPIGHLVIWDNHKKQGLTIEDATKQLNKYGTLLQDKDELLQMTLQANEYQSKQLQGAYKEIVEIKMRLNESIKNERTSIGKSVLKQFKQQIME